jgi:hypothetical protein
LPNQKYTFSIHTKHYISKVSIILVLIAVWVINFSYSYWQQDKERIIAWDVKSYYLYLPGLFIYDDLSFKFKETGTDKEKEFYKEFIWALKLDNGNNLIITSMGMSYMYLPSFLVAHIYTKLSDKYEANGYTNPYRFALIINAFLIFLVGLVYLRKILLRYFDDISTAITIFVFGIGTNMLFYATLDPGMTHIYNFSLIAIFLYQLIKWEESKKSKYLIYLGLIGGLITLIRPTNILIYVVVLLWNVANFKDFKERFIYLVSDFKIPLILIFTFLVPWIPQMIYWKIYTGKLLFFAYGEKDAHFFWANPQILKFLFSYWKGWYVYTPVMFIATIGFAFLYVKRKPFFIPFFIYVALMVYVLSSWWSWWFGGSFGTRSMVDTYAIMAFPFATITEYILKRKIIKWFYFFILINFIWYNVFQMLQYETSALHYWSMTKEMYRETFLKLKPTKKYWEIARIPDYEAAHHGIYRLVTPKELESRKQAYGKVYGTPETYIDFYKKQILNNPEALKKTINKYPLLSKDAAVEKEAFVLYQNLNNGKTKKELIKHYSDMVLEIWPDECLKKASEQDVPIDTIAYRDAIWFYNKFHYTRTQLLEVYMTEQLVDSVLQLEIPYD